MRFFVVCVACLAWIGLLCVAQSGDAAGIAFSPTAWPKETGAAVNSSPMLGDLDGDGVLEIVVGSDNGKVYAWKPDGTVMPGWPVATGDSVRSSPALADIDGDGRLDVIVGSFDNKVYAWNFNGSLLPGWPVVTGSVVYSSPSVGDIDGDQLPEIVVGSFDNKVYAWNPDGTLVREWPKPTGLFVYSSPALADIDGDGLPEVIIGTDNNRVFAWNGDGTEVEGWPAATEHVVPSSPAVGDLDHDGNVEVVAGSWDQVFVWNSNGERRPGWPVTAGHQIPSSPALADLNNDGALEILIGCKDGKVYAWDAAGRAVLGWPTITDAEISGSPVIADVNGDGKLEVIIGSKDSKTYVWDNEGRLLPGWPKNTAGAISDSPAIADVDGDGTLEVFIGSKDTKIYAWNFPRTGSSTPHIVWQNFRKDLAHTGFYGAASATTITVAKTSAATPENQQSSPIIIKTSPGTPENQQPSAVKTPPPPTLESGSSTSRTIQQGPIVPQEIVDGLVNDLVVSGSTEKEITLTWTSPAGMRTPQTVYDIRYSAQPITQETWQDATPYSSVIHPNEPGAKEVYQLPYPSLPEGQKAEGFYVALKFRDGEKNSPLSNVVRLEKLDATPPAKIQDLQVTELSDTLVELSWHAPGDDDMQGTAANYDLRYSDAPLSEITWARATQVDNKPAPLPAGREQTFQVQKPWNDKEIFWGIKAIDKSLNISELSNVVAWSPKDAIPPSRIVDVHVTRISGTKVTISWTAPGNNLNVGTAQKYDIRFSDYPITEADWSSATSVENPPEPGNAGSAQTYTLEDIPIGATKFVGIKTIDSSGNLSALSNVVETAMNDKVPPAAITDMNVVNTGKDQVVISWTATGDDASEGTASAYVLRYAGNPRVLDTWGSAIDVQHVPVPASAGTRETAIVSGLNENTTYYIGLRAIDKEGNMSELSNIVRVKTLGLSTPEAVTDLVVEEMRPDGITLNWSAPQDFGENTDSVSEYDVRYAMTPITEDSWESAAKIPNAPKPGKPQTLETFIFKGGPKDSGYYVAVKSADGAGNVSPLSNVLHIPQIDTVAPDPVIDLAVEDSGQDWVKINWTETGNDRNDGQANTVLIRVAPTLKQLQQWHQATEIPNTLQPSVSGTKDEFTLSGLKSDSTFYIALKVADEFGNMSEISNIVRAKTKDTLAPAAITDLQVLNAEKDQVVLTWTATGENGNEGQAKAYDVRYAPQPITAENWQDAQLAPVAPRPSKAGKTDTVMVTGLTSNAKYFFGVVAIDNSGNASPLSNIVETMTGDTIAPAAITTLRVEQVRSDAVALTWMSPGDDEFHNTPARYEIRYSQKALDDTSWSQATLAEITLTPAAKGETERLELAGLEPNSTYSIAVKAIDDAENTSELSNIVQVFTADDAVTDLSILKFSEQTVTLTWTIPGGEITGAERKYDVRYATNSITEEDWENAIPIENLSEEELTVNAPGKTQKIELTGLPFYEKLFFAIKVVSPTESGEPRLSKLSNVVELNRIDIIAPGAITDLQLKDMGAASDGTQAIELTWNAPGDNDFDGTVAKYEIRYGITSPTEENWQTLTKVSDVVTPVEAKTVQQATIHIPIGEDVVYFAMKAYDEAFNISKLSNVVQWVPDDQIAPSMITDLQAERIDSENVQVFWTAPGNNENRGTAAFYDIRYAEKESAMKEWNEAAIVQNEPLPEVVGTKQEYTINGLRADTTYYIAMKTTDNAKNTSELSNIVILEAVAVTHIGDLTFVGGNETAVTLSWKAPSPRVREERIVRYDIRYSEDQGTLQEWNHAKKVKHAMVPQEPGETESITVEKLEPNKRYYFAIKTIESRDDDTSEMSNIVAAYTTDTIPPKPVNDLMIQDTTRNSVTLAWTVREDDASHEMPDVYEIRYSLNSLNDSNWEQADVINVTDDAGLKPSAPGAQMTYTVTGLAENTTYYFNIRAIDGSENRSPLADNLLVRTKDVTPPQTIADVQAIFPTTNSVALSWTCPADQTGEFALVSRGVSTNGVPETKASPEGTAEPLHEDLLVSAYDIRYLPVEQPGIRLDDSSWDKAEKVLMPPKPLTPGTTETFVVENLKPGTTYYFAIKALDASGNPSALSNVVAETTLPSVAASSGQTQGRGIASPGESKWEILQGQEIGEIQRDDSGTLRLMKKPGSRGLTPETSVTAVYPQSNNGMAVKQGELAFQVKSAERFTVCSTITAASGEQYYLCYLPMNLPTSENRQAAPLSSDANASAPSTIAPRMHKRIGNYIFFTLDPSMSDDQWHNVDLNLAQDFLTSTGQIYSETTRLVMRGKDVSFREMMLKGPVATKIADFEDRLEPLEHGWNLHFGTGSVKITKEPNAENWFLAAKSDDGGNLVVTYPKESTGQLSDKPIFQAHVKAVDGQLPADFKLIVKTQTVDNQEYYLTYLPGADSQQQTPSGNYIYLQLSAKPDLNFSKDGSWLLIEANMSADLEKRHFRYAYTSWVSFHGKELQLDNVQFSTEVLETAVK